MKVEEEQEQPAGAEPELQTLLQEPGEPSASDSVQDNTPVLQDSDCAVFPVPEIAPRRPSQEDIMLRSLAEAVDSSSVIRATGKLAGRQGNWKPGPGRRPLTPEQKKEKQDELIRRKALRAGAGRLRWDADPEQKHKICLQITADFKASGESRTAM